MSCEGSGVRQRGFPHNMLCLFKKFTQEWLNSLVLQVSLRKSDVSEDGHAVRSSDRGEANPMTPKNTNLYIA